MKSGRVRFISLPLFLLGFFLLFSCAPSVKQYPKINQLLLTQDYDSACKLVKESKKTYAKRNAALYHLDQGILLHYAARYNESK